MQRFRRIGSFKTNGSAQIIAFVQDGDLFQWITLVSDVNAANPGTSAFTRTLGGVPTGVNVEAILRIANSSTDVSNVSYTYLSDLAATDSTPQLGISDLPPSLLAAGGTSTPAGVKYVRTNTSAQIRSRISFSSANVTLLINTLGWIDQRGRDA